MDDLRLAPTAGIAASLAVLAALAVPYVLGVVGVESYYGSGSVNPLLAGLFALVAVIVFAAGREGRSDPQLAAGVALALGAFTVLVTLAWALTVRPDAAQFSVNHRWLVVGVAALVPLSAGWYARALGVL
ncbi:MAG: hypothetical protein ABEJ30_05220 [Halorientalis sp.]